MKSDTPLSRIMAIIKTLRGENGCPWDRKQTPETMANYLVEEVYELVDAIASGKPESVLEELGDVLFLLFFIIGLYEESGHFNLEQVAAAGADKMIRRHPHVFADAEVADSDEVRQQWHEIKKEEKNHQPRASILDSIPKSLPALMRAYRVSERAARIGFDWENITGVMNKVEEEWKELVDELTPIGHKATDSQSQALEFGDVLFTLVNVARFARIHPETALSASTRKFETRFRHMEKSAESADRVLEDLPREEMERLWNKAKNEV